VTDDQGRFTILGVAPGEYVLRVLRGPGGGEFFAGATGIATTSEGATILSTGSMVEVGPPDPAQQMPTRYASTPVVVADADVNDVTLTVRRGVRLSGQVEFSGTSDRPTPEQLERLHLLVEARDGRMPGWDFEMTGSVTRDQRFQTVELPPGSYYVRMPRPPAGWALESITYGGRDVSEVAIDVADRPIASLVVRFTDRPNRLSGTVRTASTVERLEDAFVVVFPTDRTGWTDFGMNPRRLQSAAVGQEGSFSIQALPGGDYFVAAIRDDFLNDWRHPEFLERVSRVATRVTVSTNGQQSIALVMRSVR
jgi:hypothetical protein